MKIDIEQFLDSVEYRESYFADYIIPITTIGSDMYSTDYCLKNLKSTWEIHKLSPVGRETECVFSSRNQSVAERKFHHYLTERVSASWALRYAMSKLDRL